MAAVDEQEHGSSDNHSCCSSNSFEHGNSFSEGDLDASYACSNMSFDNDRPEEGFDDSRDGSLSSRATADLKEISLSGLPSVAMTTHAFVPDSKSDWSTMAVILSAMRSVVSARGVEPVGAPSPARTASTSPGRPSPVIIKGGLAPGLIG